jgi:4-hydroxybutyrate dehydrogenase
MGSVLTLPRLVFGPGTLVTISDELAQLGVRRPLLISDRGLESAGLVTRVRQAAPAIAAEFLDVPENPNAAGMDGAATAWRDGGCDSIIALGGGSVLDTAKQVAALVTSGLNCAADIIGKPELITRNVSPLIAIPTTVGTGSESSPVTSVHLVTGGPAIGTRSPWLVPRVALCDPDLARTLPPRLIAATGIDALSHCIEGYFANSEHPIIDALALDGVCRVIADIHAALLPEGDAARASLMAAAYAGGVAINKGVGPAHAIALVCGDQHVHHGTVIAVALPHTTSLLVPHVPEKSVRLRQAMGLEAGANIGAALHALIASLGIPLSLREAGYRMERERGELVAAMASSHFNRTSAYAPSAAEYGAILDVITG